MKKIIAISAAVASFGFASAAQAQNAETVAGPYVGVQGGYQELATVDVPTIGGGGTEINIDGATFGVLAGYNIPAGEDFVIGFEGGANLGTSDIDNDFSVSAHAGFTPAPNTLLFVRGGYQFYDVDVINIAEEFLGREVTDAERDALNQADELGDGVMIGAGADIGVGETVGIRLVADTVEFDTYRVAAGVVLRF